MRSIPAVVALALAASSMGQAQELVLVAGGRSDYQIVVAEHTTKVALTAANELQTWIEAATGVKLPIAERPDANLRHLYVGPAAVPPEWGVSLDNMPPEGFVVKTVGQDIAFVGVDGGSHPEEIVGTTAPTLCGTMNAVYDFLQQQVGVRWYWNDELGTIVPKRDELRVPALNYTERPDFIYRALPYGPTDPDGGQAATHQWGRRNRLGKSISTYHSHAWFQHLPIETYADEHPEYYALVNGQRVTRYYSNQHHGGQVCTTNPQVIEVFARACRDYFRQHPDRTMCSVSPNDGGGFCQCPDCTALDVKMWPDDGSRAGIPEMADRMLTFYNQIAERVAGEFPDRYLGAYVYGYYQRPPYRIKPHPNLALVLAINSAWRGGADQFWAEDTATMDGWCAIHNCMFMYDIFYHGTQQPGFPAPIVRHTIRYMKHLKQIGMRGGYLYIGPTWESLGPGAYLMTRLFWDADADTDAILDGWYTDLYGPAAPQVRAFYELAEQSWVRTMAGEQPQVSAEAEYFRNKTGGGQALGVAMACWQPIMGQCGELVRQAAAACATDEQRARVARVADSFEFTRASIEALVGIARFESSREPGEQVAAQVRSAIEAREAALARIGDTWSPHFRDWVRENDDSIKSPLRPTAAYFALAGEAGRVKLYAQLAEQAPVVDGDPSDAAWQAAQFVDFRENHAAEEATAPTSAAVCYDKGNLYVLFRCQEPNLAALKPEVLPRDSTELFATDNVEVFIDPDGDGLDYYHLAVNAGGSVCDALSADPETHDSEWNPDWQHAVKLGAEGWTVELCIPLVALGVDSVADGEMWRLNLHRTRRTTAGRTSEYQALSPTLGGFHQPGRFGELRFGQPVASGQNLLRKWDFERYQVGQDITGELRVAGEGEYSVQIADDRVYDGGHALKITVGPGSAAQFGYYPASIAMGSYRFAMRYYADPLGEPTPGKPAEVPVTRVIFRERSGEAVSDSRQYSWERSPAEQAEVRWADHLHVFRTLPGTQRITITVFMFRPGT
ncbi:MAG TPA: DUF4838 domain-containing protein, partial [Armatimonadota bacterium]|nr:DUF4838 domain-containing protein [Armatimonadota bacterium]